MTTAQELMHQVDSLVNLEKQVAVYRLQGMDPLVWLSRIEYERRTITDQLDRLTGKE